MERWYIGEETRGRTKKREDKGGETKRTKGDGEEGEWGGRKMEPLRAGSHCPPIISQGFVLEGAKVTWCEVAVTITTGENV